eukprot:CAMPEP_0176372008 /NCGR_PEP_ID=MMETSP0126-20121128/25095_1 /TAXON_ID=141414 ORGANISM="Strombidinopsis acuminatum, Strain SPMC142" /NCGR_SAMPLE_ID=MMETSP0126 /ASSEMBLY_ACC=CAM_ASM_000229 /LENGTH=54 /DNA_ID=CAMNT_0017731689 /DNA_START=11 /DNA_END=175 /DNA_ORIENTATION=+
MKFGEIDVVMNGAELDLNIETSFIKSVQESIIQAFKAHKKFIEKEVSVVANKIT